MPLQYLVKKGKILNYGEVTMGCLNWIHWVFAKAKKHG